MLPHIPTPEPRERFEQLASAGRNLSDLHVDYEMVVPYRLDVPLKPSTFADNCETWRVSKMKWGKKKDSETGKNVDDRTALVHNPKVTIVGIPEEAERLLVSAGVDHRPLPGQDRQGIGQRQRSQRLVRRAR